MKTGFFIVKFLNIFSVSFAGFFSAAHFKNPNFSVNETKNTYQSSFKQIDPAQLANKNIYQTLFNPYNDNQSFTFTDHGIYFSNDNLKTLQSVQSTNSYKCISAYFDENKYSNILVNVITSLGNSEVMVITYHNHDFSTIDFRSLPAISRDGVSNAAVFKRICTVKFNNEQAKIGIASDIQSASGTVFLRIYYGDVFSGDGRAVSLKNTPQFNWDKDFEGIENIISFSKEKNYFWVNTNLTQNNNHIYLGHDVVSDNSITFALTPVNFIKNEQIINSEINAVNYENVFDNFAGQSLAYVTNNMGLFTTAENNLNKADSINLYYSQLSDSSSLIFNNLENIYETRLDSSTRIWVFVKNVGLFLSTNNKYVKETDQLDFELLTSDSLTSSTFINSFNFTSLDLTLYLNTDKGLYEGFVKNINPNPPGPTPDPSPLNPKSTKETLIIALSVVSAATVLSALAGFFIWKKKKTKQSN